MKALLFGFYFLLGVAFIIAYALDILPLVPAGCLAVVSFVGSLICLVDRGRGA